MTTVVHCRQSRYDVYIGRAHGDLPESKWANPFIIGKDGERDEVIAKYEAWLKTNPELMAALPELKDKVLGCWCKPEKRCHGDVLARLIDGEVKLEIPVSPKPDIPRLSPNADILPLFATNYSLCHSLLTVDEAGKSVPGTPVSICDIAKDYKLSHVTIVDDKIDGFPEAWKNIQKAGIAQLVFGLKMVCCADHNDKSDESLRTESKVVILVKSEQGYYDLLPIHNLANSEDFYYQPRTSWKRLKELWTPNLSLAIPFFSGFLTRNSLYFSSVVPDFPVPTKDVWLFNEIDSGLPFASIIGAAMGQFASETEAQVQKVKSIYYPTRDLFRSYMIMRAIEGRATFSRPQVDHLASDRFSWERYVELTKETV